MTRGRVLAGFDVRTQARLGPGAARGHRQCVGKALAQFVGVQKRVTRFICPKCDAATQTPGELEAHLVSEHPRDRAALGFGHTLDQ